MGVIRKSISFTEKQDLWIKRQIQNGDYTNDSEYVRDLIRKDQEEKENIEALRVAIQEGIDSGISNRSVEDIWKEAEEKHACKKE